MPELFPLQREEITSLKWLLEYPPFNDLTEEELFSSLSSFDFIPEGDLWSVA